MRRVVILNTSDAYLPAFLVIDGTLRETIRARSLTPVQFYGEALDMFRFPRALLEDDLAALLRRKYRDLRVDVVVADETIALDFARRHREEIWPGATIVFNSVPAAALPGLGLEPDTIGIPLRLELEATLDLALKLRPEAKRIAVVAGNADQDLKLLSLARAALERRRERLDVQYLVGLAVPDTVAAVQALPPDAAILYLTVFRDGTGAPQVPRDVLTRIAAASRAPIFGMFETYLGDGIAAGSIAGYATQGRLSGELVARVLNGENPAAIGVQAPVEPGCMADWRQLLRWDIDKDLLPAGCEIRFREVSAWDRYRWQILAALAVMLAQAALIAALLLNRRRLGHARVSLADECDRRTRAEALAAQLRGRLTRFGRERSLGTMATAIAHEIAQPLIAIQNYAQAAKRRLHREVEDKPKIVALVEKIAGQAERAGAITQRVRSLVNCADVQLEPVDLCAVVEEVVRMMTVETESRGCRILCEPVGDLPSVLADPLQIQLVLVNLLQNAIQSVHASERFEKRVSLDACPTDRREVQVSVTDWGPGVPPDRVSEIFEPLYSGTGGGMGMGLAISRAIVDAHGGGLWHEPNPAGGAIFRFTLRAADL